jgi:hypothetical protein
VTRRNGIVLIALLGTPLALYVALVIAVLAIPSAHSAIVMLAPMGGLLAALIGMAPVVIVTARRRRRLRS